MKQSIRRSILVGAALLTFTGCAKFFPALGPKVPSRVEVQASRSCDVRGINMDSVRCLHTQVRDSIAQVHGAIPGELGAFELQRLEQSGLLGSERHSEDFWQAIAESMRVLHSEGRPALQSEQADQFFRMIEHYPELLNWVALLSAGTISEVLDHEPEVLVAQIRDVARPALARLPEFTAEFADFLTRSGGKVSPMLVLRWSSVVWPILREWVELDRPSSSVSDARRLRWRDLATTVFQAGTAMLVSLLRDEAMSTHELGLALREIAREMPHWVGQGLEAEEAIRTRIESLDERWEAIRPQATAECTELDRLVAAPASTVSNEPLLTVWNWNCLKRAAYSVIWDSSDTVHWYSTREVPRLEVWDRVSLGGAFLMRGLYLARGWGLQDLHLVQDERLGWKGLRKDLQTVFAEGVTHSPSEEGHEGFWGRSAVRPVVWRLAQAVGVQDRVNRCLEMGGVVQVPPDSTLQLSEWSALFECTFDQVDQGLMQAIRGQIDLLTLVTSPFYSVSSGLSDAAENLRPYNTWFNYLTHTMEEAPRMQLREAISLVGALGYQSQIELAGDPWSDPDSSVSAMPVMMEADWSRMREFVADQVKKVQLALKRR